jgi:hypothetical protein
MRTYFEAILKLRRDELRGDDVMRNYFEAILELPRDDMTFEAILKL